MKIIKLKKIDVNEKELRKRWALESDWKIVLDEECIVYDADTGEYLFWMFNLKRNPAELISALNSINFITTKRTNWLLSTSRIFGYSPRIKMRNDYCNKTSLQIENKAAHDVITSYVDDIEEIYKQYATEAYEAHREKSGKVASDWRIRNAIFTSGIVNKNNQLKYHYDAWNFEDCYSCMITIKEWIQGWFLMIPSYNCLVKTFSNSLFMFDGQKILHWVSPIRKVKKDAYRYTVVFYSLKSMRQCVSPKDELARIRLEKTKLYMSRKDILKNKAKDENSNTK